MHIVMITYKNGMRDFLREPNDSSAIRIANDNSQLHALKKDASWLVDQFKDTKYELYELIKV